MPNVVGLLLDASGSMGGSRAIATVDGFNSFLSMQQLREDDCTVAYAQYNDFLKGLTFKHLGDMRPLIVGTSYTPGGNTALYYQLVRFLGAIDDYIRDLPADQTPDDVTIILQSDGADSRGDSAARALASEAISIGKSKGWKFIFLALITPSDNTALVEAERLGFSARVPYQVGESVEIFEATAAQVIESLIQE